ncbi:hypothetical protein [Nocardia beijingensis]
MGYSTDAELVADLVATGFDPGLLASLERQLWLYGWRVLRGKVRDLSILHIRTGLPPLHVSADDHRTLHDSPQAREELVVDTLALAVGFMVNQLRNERWDPDRSRSDDPKLGTFFTSVCAIKFRDVYKAWHRKRVDRMRERLVEPQHNAFLRAAYDDPSDAVVDRFRLREILKAATLEDRLICAGLLVGKPRAEIADELGISTRALEGRLYRLRQRTWENLGAAPIRRKKRQQESA